MYIQARLVRFVRYSSGEATWSLIQRPRSFLSVNLFILARRSLMYLFILLV